MLLQRGTADATSGCVASGQARRDRLQMEAEKKGAALAAVRKREREALERAEQEERARNLQTCEEARSLFHNVPGQNGTDHTIIQAQVAPSPLN